MRSSLFHKEATSAVPQDAHVQDIQREYHRIDGDWLKFHYHILVWLYVFSFFVECLLGVIVVHSDLMHTTVPIYLRKYVLTPGVLNGLGVAISIFVVRSKRFSQEFQIMTVSLSFVFMCFVIFTAHNIFVATYYIFAVAIMLTIVYASYRVTLATAVLSLTAVGFSEMFIQWDPDKQSIYDSTMRMSDFLIALSFLLAFSVVCLVLITYERKKNDASIQMAIERHRLKQKLNIDELTGLYNRVGLRRALMEMEESSPGHPYSLAIADLDRFKRINDTWGHMVGDQCLLAFSRIVRDNGGKFVPFRYGGDEFCFLFRDIRKMEAASICEKIRKQLVGYELEGYPDIKLTVSFGVAERLGDMDATKLFVHGDRALYEAKKDRNCVQLFEYQPEES